MAEQFQAVVCTLGDEEYALPVSEVQEIIRYVTPRSLPGVDPGVRGVINLRGKIVSVCDLSGRLGLSSTGMESKIVVVEGAGEMAGLIVDEVSEVVTLSTDQIEPPLTTSDGAISGVAKVGDRLLVVLDLEALFGADPLDDTIAEAA